ncbi:Hypothetical predicted protein [Paramuricea clavata]|uniref:Uncharacterized protein n=1 Tax=Paramuricea clavata TaxID=317549 RepID=A0A7D9HUF8_PARCT|nr:Hypothetical predicted protein [Paramuricea clavata]
MSPLQTIQAGRTNSSHFLSECNFLPDQDRRYMVKARQIAEILEDIPKCESSINPVDPACDLRDEESKTSSRAYRIQARQSPYVDMFYHHHPVRIAIDSGATGNMIRHRTVQCLGCHIAASSQSVHQADGLVIENLDVDVLAASTATARRALVLRAPPTSTTVWPGEFVEIELPGDAPADTKYALEPRIDAPSVKRLTASQLWPCPNIVSSVAGRIRIPNLSSEPRSLKRNEHFCQVRPVYTPDLNNGDHKLAVHPAPKSLQTHKFSSDVCLETDNLLPQDVRRKFTLLMESYDHVFDRNIKGYNGAAGSFEAKLNMGPVEPPQRKGRLPQYTRDQLQELQAKVLGNLLEEGVVAKIADDLYCQGNTLEEPLQNWKRVLVALHKSDLRLSALKTVINPKSTTILGWIWNSGTLSASPHRIATFASCQKPETAYRQR